MIALCPSHHAKADAGAFTASQLRALKRKPPHEDSEPSGRFDWLRNRLLAVIGGNFFYDTPTVFRFRGEPAIWFNRDDEGRLLLNLRMLTTSGQPRLRLEDSYWTAKGDPTDLECPPSGRLIRAAYANGDQIRVEFFELLSVDAVAKRYPETQVDLWPVEFPITAVEVMSKVGGTAIAFGPRWSTLPGGNMMQNCFSAHCATGLAID